MSLLRGVLGAALIAMMSTALACEPAAIPRRSAAEPTPTPAPSVLSGRPRPLPGGGYNLEITRTVPGEPFDVTVMYVSDLEVRNNTGVQIQPVCVLDYGSQRALIDIDDVTLQPRERVWVEGETRLGRPLDDYESGDAFCYHRIPSGEARLIKHQQRMLTVGRSVKVPNLVGRLLNSQLPSFRRGLDLRIVQENTPCDRKRLMEMSRYVNPFGRQPCGDPRIVAQTPEPGAESQVGDEIRVTVTSRSG